LFGQKSSVTSSKTVAPVFDRQEHLNFWRLKVWNFFWCGQVKEGGEGVHLKFKLPPDFSRFYVCIVCPIVLQFNIWKAVLQVCNHPCPSWTYSCSVSFNFKKKTCSTLHRHNFQCNMSCHHQRKKISCQFRFLTYMIYD
jgi:hypothetical protein